MPRSRSRLVLAYLALGATAALGAVAASAEAPPRTPPPPRLFGAWVFNQQLTAELAERSRGENPSGGGHRGGFGHGGHGGDGPRGGGRSPGADGDSRREGGRAAIAGLIFSAAPDGAVLLTEDSGRARRFDPGAPAKRDTEAPDGAQVAASWDADGDLVVEVKPDRGPRRTETYIVDHEKKHLYVTTVVTSGFGSRSLTLAFDPVDPATLPQPGTGS